MTVILFSSTAEQHAQKLERVLERFEKANLQLHLGKCAIAQPQVNYLGYTLTEEVSASSDKVETVKNYPIPRNAKDVKAFLGLASFYCRLVPKLAETAKPLMQLIRKNHEFVWGPAHRASGWFYYGNYSEC
jgi:hypothetical protein